MKDAHGDVRRRADPAHGNRWLRWAAGTAAAVIAGAAFTGAYVAARYEARLGQMAREAVAARERLQRSEAALREQLTLHRGALDLLRDPATRVLELHGQGATAQASGRVVWHAAAGGHLFVANLPPPPAGRMYVVWTTAAAPRPAGRLVVDAAGHGSHRLEPVAGGEAVKAFSVTLEPEGASAPTGPTVLVSANR